MTQTPASTPKHHRRPRITVGQYTLSERPTGCTVILAANGAVGGVDVRGGAPGTVETDLLSPENTVERVNAVFLSGGSAFGLATRDGVVTFLADKKIGYATGAGPVPIVPGAILYDLNIGGRPEIRPGADCGARAAAAAKAGPIDEGRRRRGRRDGGQVARRCAGHEGRHRIDSPADERRTDRRRHRRGQRGGHGLRPQDRQSCRRRAND